MYDDVRGGCSPNGDENLVEVGKSRVAAGKSMENEMKLLKVWIVKFESVLYMTSFWLFDCIDDVNHEKDHTQLGFFF